MDSGTRNSSQITDDPNRWLDDDILRRIIEMNPIDARAGKFDKIYVPKEIRGKVPLSRLWLILEEFRKMRAKEGARGSVDVLALRLSASGHPSLFDYVRKGGEFSVSDAHRVVRLIDFGAESFVFLGKDSSGAPVAIKSPFLDFTNLAHLDIDQLLRRRRRLTHEANMLRVLAGTAFPAFIAEQVAPNPLFPPRIPPFLRDSEHFLVIEYVKGIRVDSLARFFQQHDRACCALRLAAEFATTFFNLSKAIAARIGPGAAYTDIKPENALLQDSGMRIVDASSIVTNTNTEPRSFSVSEVYLEPSDYHEWAAGNLVPDTPFIVRSVVRAVHALVANTPLFVAQASPSWPAGALVDFGPTLDTLADDLKIDLHRAADTSHALLNRLSCEHGSGPICMTSSV